MTGKLGHKMFNQDKLELVKMRKNLIKLHCEARNKIDNHYEVKMKKIIKKISTIIYHHVLHSHKHIPKPSEGATLFSEKLITKKKDPKSAVFVSGVPGLAPSFVYHSEKEEKKKTSEEKKFSKYIIYEYIVIIFSWLHLALECSLITLIYLEKLMVQARVEMRLSNWRPLLLTCIIILASKYWEEWGYWNSDFFWNYWVSNRRHQ